MKTTSPARTAITVLIITIIWMAFEHLMGWNTTRHDIGQWAHLFAPLLFWISLFVVVYNEKKKRGTLTFNEGWKAGMVTSFIYAAGFTIIIVIYQQLINPEYYETLKAFKLRELQSHNATQQQIDASMKELEMTANGSATSYFLLFVFTLAWGILLSAIASLIYKTKKRESVG